MARTYEKKAFTPECVPEILKGTAFMEEAGADTFEISDLPFVPSGVLAHVLRSDDVAIAVDGTYTNGKAVVTLDADCYHVAGRLSVAIYITDASMNSQCVYACVGNVYRTVGDTELDSGTEVPTLAQMEAAYQACISATQQATNAVSYVEQTGKTDVQKAQARTNIGAISDADLDDLRMTDLQLGGAISDVGHSLAADYNWQTGTYAVGDYVMYGDKLYRCATAIATPETWTPAHWTEVKLSGDVADLRGASCLEIDEIPDTVQSISFDSNGNVSQIVHKKRTDQTVTIRTDVFTFAGNAITEVRTLSTGESLTIVTDTDTLVTTVTYADAA